jgi:hypothetical protein
MARGRKQSVHVGGGAPALVGAGVTTPERPEDALDPTKKTGSMSSTLSMSRPAADAGREVVERVRDAIKKFKRDGGDSEIRTLGFLVQYYPAITLRVPEFFDFMDWLLARREDGALARIMGDATRGRRRESPFYLIAFVELVCQRNGCSVARAAQWIEDNVGAKFNKCATSIQNDYSRYRDHYRIWRSQFVPGNKLTPAAWCRPEK